MDLTFQKSVNSIGQNLIFLSHKNSLELSWTSLTAGSTFAPNYVVWSYRGLEEENAACFGHYWISIVEQIRFIFNFRSLYLMYSVFRCVCRASVNVVFKFKA